MCFFRKKTTIPPIPPTNIFSLPIQLVPQIPIPSNQISALAAALNIQIARDFGPAWGVYATIGNKGWPIYLLGLSDVQGALGYHALDATGTPFAKIFTETASQSGMAWQIVVSHELCEMLVDPFVFNTAPNTLQNPVTDFWMVETADPVEGYSYRINNIDVSDFVFPAWFGAPGSQYDFLNKTSAPFQVSPTGYALKYVNGVVQQLADKDKTTSVDKEYWHGKIY